MWTWLTPLTLSDEKTIIQRRGWCLATCAGVKFLECWSAQQTQPDVILELRPMLIQMKIWTNTFSLWWKPPEIQPCRETRCLNFGSFESFLSAELMTWVWWIVIIIMSVLNLRHPLRSHGRPRWPSQESWLKLQLNVFKLNEAQSDARIVYSSSQMISHFAPSLTGPWDW